MLSYIKILNGTYIFKRLLTVISLRLEKPVYLSNNCNQTTFGNFKTDIFYDRMFFCIPRKRSIPHFNRICIRLFSANCFFVDFPGIQVFIHSSQRYRCLNHLDHQRRKFVQWHLQKIKKRDTNKRLVSR